ncbi:DUF6543 domain-containing protein [Pseudomonas sp. SIMBA_077]
MNRETKASDRFHPQALLQLDYVSEAVKQNVPPWLLSAQTTLRSKIIQLLITTHALEAKLTAHLSHVTAPVVFAKGLLNPALKAKWGSRVDSEQNVYVNVRRFSLSMLNDAIKDPLDVLLPRIWRPITSVTHVSLLEAAMQNFSLEEVRDDVGAGAYVLESSGSQQRIVLNPQHFAQLCRTLNMGRKYQDYLKTIFYPVERINPIASDLSGYGVYQDFILHANSQLELLTHQAYLTQAISSSVYQMLLQWVSGDPAPRWNASDVRVCHMAMLNVNREGVGRVSCPLSGVLVFMAKSVGSDLSQPCVVYCPHDKEQPLIEYASLQRFNDLFAFRLRETGFKEVVSQRVEQRYQPAFIKALNHALLVKGRTAVLTKVDTWRPHPDLQITLVDSGLRPCVALYKQCVEQVLNHALFMIVPTKEQDTSNLSQVSALFEAAQPFLNLAAFFVPSIGRLMMLVTTVQLLSHIYIGVEDWSNGEVKQALEHFESVAQNLLVMAVGARATKEWSSFKPEIAYPSLLDTLRRVKTEAGETRLMNVDLAPYASDVKLHEDLKPDAEGIYRANERTFIHIKGKPYEIKYDEASNHWRLQHPKRQAAYAPVVEHNAHGAWFLSLERASAWDKRESLHRVSSYPQALSESHVEQVLNIVGAQEDAVRWSHANREPPPALVVDTLKRLKLANEVEQEVSRLHATESVQWQEAQKKTLFSERYTANEVFAEGPMAIVHRHHSSLPANVVREVLEHASVSEIRALNTLKKVPLRLAEELRLYSHGLKVTRALEGFYLDVDDPASTLRLVGALFMKTAQGKHYVSAGQEPLLLNVQGGKPLSESQAQRALKLVNSDPLLRDQLVQYANDHLDETRSALGLQPIKPWFKSPMRLANGRLGYPLSGRGTEQGRSAFQIRRVQALYPGYSNTQCREFFAALEKSKVNPELELVRRELEYEALLDMLHSWVRQPLPEYSIQARRDVSPLTFKRAASNVISRAWRRETRLEDQEGGLSEYVAEAGLRAQDLPDPRRHVLDLSGMPIGDLPALPGDFRHISVLIMDDMALAEIPEGFLESFTGLRWLSMQRNQLTTLPLALAHMSGLLKLDLGHNQIGLTPETVNTLAGLTDLRELNLTHNALGQTVDVSRMQRLRHLDLRHTQSVDWPVGVHTLNEIAHLDLRENNIHQIPDEVFNASERLNAITYLHDNSLSPVSEQRLNEYAERTGINMGYVSGRGHNFLTDPQSYSWFLGGAESESAKKGEIWLSLEQDPQTHDLRRVLMGQTGTPAYANESTRDALSEQIGAMLLALGEDTALRESLTVRAGHGSTCGDGLALIFSDLEIITLVAKARAPVGVEGSELELLRLARSLYRLDQVEVIARHLLEERYLLGRDELWGELNELDEVEFRLAFRIALAGPLELPAQPQAMAYEDLADVSQMAIDGVRHRVLANERLTSNLRDSICEREFWVSFLKEKYAHQFEAILERHMERTHAIEAEAHSTSDEAYKQALEKISNDYNVATKAWIKRLTDWEMTVHQF